MYASWISDAGNIFWDNVMKAPGVFGNLMGHMGMKYQVRQTLIMWFMGSTLGILFGYRV